MKNFLRYLWFWIIACSLAACSNGDDGALPKRPMTFSASDEVPTRGVAYDSSWGTTNGSIFNVQAYHYPANMTTPLQMMDNDVTRDGTVWGYSPVVYWPTDGVMDFFSYAPACDGARKEFSRFTPNHTNYQALMVDCHVPASQITTIHSLGTDNVAITTYPHDAANQYDLMFAYERNMVCAEQAVTSRVNMRFVHVMSGVKLDLDGLVSSGKIEAGTQKIVIGVGRIRTGGTLAICEPDVVGGLPEVMWTLDGLEGTFYETYTVKWNGAGTAVESINREDTGMPGGVDAYHWTNDHATFFFPPQKFDSDLTVTAYFYNAENKRIKYSTQTIPNSGDGSIEGLERGKIIKLNIK